jgi:predicted aspartyl protease
VTRRTEFPYLKDAAGRYAPIVYLQVWTGNRWLYLQAYVDSGASWTIFHADVAQLLGIKLSQGRRRYMALGNGSVIPITLHRIRVRFAGVQFTAPVGFSDSLRVGFNLLGRAGFFERFVMCFHDRARVLTATALSQRIR